MEKYGVDTEGSETEKLSQAQDKRRRPTCPRCGALLRSVDVTGVPLCPNCGSRPFEEEGK